MANITVTITGIGKDFAKTQMTTIAAISEKHMEQMARETELVIKQKIKERIERSGSTGNLANSFNTFKTDFGWGVGNIAYLNTYAKQWYWLNFGVAQTGRKIPPGTRENPRIKGHFDSASGGRFKSGQPRFPMNPTKAPEAKNYIQATINEIPSIIALVLGRKI